MYGSRLEVDMVLKSYDMLMKVNKNCRLMARITLRELAHATYRNFSAVKIEKFIRKNLMFSIFLLKT